MRPPDGLTPGLPEDWLRLAQADLVLSRISVPEDGLYSTLCFHAQQCVEKSVKAVLIFRGIPIVPTHSIARLIDSLPPDMPLPPVLLESACLTPYATTYRYPVEDDDLDVPEAEYREAIRLAESVFQWAVHAIRSDSSSSPSRMPHG